VLYGSGVQLNEGLSLRAKDLDFAQHQIIVRNPKGYESRVTMLPTSLVDPLKLHLEWVQRARCTTVPLRVPWISEQCLYFP
jgi:site-specific recombinase XerD